MINFVFIAPPAAGKGTQSKLLVENYNYVHISTGDLLREAAKDSSSLGIQINNLISNGKLVDDDLMILLLKNKLKSVVECNKAFIIDGFPRNLNQAVMLTNLFDELNVNNYKVINMNLDYDEALKRVLGRLVCPNCKTSYNYLIDNLKPVSEGICDKCRVELVKRNDDNEKTFKDRYDTYLNLTVPIISYFTNLNKIINIDANKSSDEIFENIKTYVTEVM